MEGTAKTSEQEKCECHYNKLIELAELESDEMTESECDNAVKAMTRILKYGTCSDVAHGMKYYINFLHCKEDMGK